MEASGNIGVYKACYPMVREAWVVRAMCCLKIDPLRCYTILRLAADDMPPLTPQMLADEAAVTINSAYQVLKLLKAEGSIVRDPSGHYHLTIPIGTRKFYSLIHLSTKCPVPDHVAHLDAVPKQLFEWTGLSKVKRDRQKKDSWSKRELRNVIQRSSPEHFRDLLKEYGMKPIRESATTMKPRHRNEKRWRRNESSSATGGVKPASTK
jgi:hypothetical protein